MEPIPFDVNFNHIDYDNAVAETWKPSVADIDLADMVVEVVMVGIVIPGSHFNPTIYFGTNLNLQEEIPFENIIKDVPIQGIEDAEVGKVIIVDVPEQVGQNVFYLDVFYNFRVIDDIEDRNKDNIETISLDIPDYSNVSPTGISPTN